MSLGSQSTSSLTITTAGNGRGMGFRESGMIPRNERVSYLEFEPHVVF